MLDHEQCYEKGLAIEGSRISRKKRKIEVLGFLSKLINDI